MLNGAPVRFRSLMQKTEALSVTEEELYAAIMTTQDILYFLHVLESIGLNAHNLYLHFYQHLVNTTLVGNRVSTSEGLARVNQYASTGYIDISPPACNKITHQTVTI